MPVPVELDFDWRTLTATVNEIKSPNQFVKRLLFGNEITFPTETLEIGVLEGDRQMAPFVKKNGQALLAKGIGEKTYTVEAPNIRLKKPFEAHQSLFQRTVGTDIFISGTPVSAIQAKIARQLQQIEYSIVNTEEWLCCMALRGTITYSTEDASWEIVFPKPAANIITLTTFWDQANSDPEGDFFTAKKVVSDAVGLQLTDVIMSESAAREFKSHSEVRAVLDNKSISAGGLDLKAKFRDDGAVFIGEVFGLNCWMYHRTVLDPAGAVTTLIRDKWVEFVSNSSAAENEFRYAAIPDWDLFQDGSPLDVKRLSKSWLEKDPSVRWMLVASRPLPVTRRPGSMVSMKVISG